VAGCGARNRGSINFESCTENVKIKLQLYTPHMQLIGCCLLRTNKQMMLFTVDDRDAVADDVYCEEPRDFKRRQRPNVKVENQF
jgi:hypothetical protein